MMETSRIMHLFFQHLPDFFRKKLSHKENDYFASMTNIPENLCEENYIYDSDGYLLFMKTTQSNLSLFNISSDSLLFNENEDFNIQSKQLWNTSIKYSNSSIDIKKSSIHHSTIIFSPKTNTLQRWRRLELLNTYA